jgi:eukaryotic-like serine/threonine-protein kinase
LIRPGRGAILTDMGEEADGGPAGPATETASVAAGPGTMTASVVAAPRLAPPAAPALSPGTLPSLPAAITERYEILELLGRGGMGAVHRARDRRLDREVALKLLFDDTEGERLLREARAQARVEHEHACKIYEVGVEDGTGYIAMQLVVGEPLGRAAAHMTVEQKVRVVRQVCLALHEAHRLGLVHRDVKPSNILVERGDDGTFRPYLTDFGIARDVGAAGCTVTGVIAGTPAFMAPEQARGEVRALDRRTDVYGLGATAYDVLAGRPPFQADTSWTLIQQILSDDPPPLRRVAPELPADLEAIVARCLEKDPGRRYASARALADDLQRFLDGDPVEARRLSVGYVLVRKARRHRARLALAGVALVAALVVAALWIRDRQLGARRADLARELGQDAKEMEVFLQRAYQLPPHDVEREREVIRARLRSIVVRMAVAGPDGVGPGSYALGRGYLALQEPDRARAHLAAAREAGYESPSLDYAMGLVLGELYDRALVQAKQIGDPEQRAARLAALEAEYAVPATRHLQAALAAQLESPAYVEGLIALLRGRPEEALAKAKSAFEQAPWLYEAKRLEGDARSAMGSRFGPDAAFDYGKMMAEYRPAAEAYRGAADIARSDPAVHLAECRLWAQIMNASTTAPDTLRSSYEQAVAACGRASEASSRSASARIERAFVEATYAWLIASGDTRSDPGPVVDAAIAHAMEAAALAPDEPMAPYVVGHASGTRAYYLNNIGADSRPASERAIAAYEDALRHDPAFRWALGDLAAAYLEQAVRERLRGADPSGAIARVVERSGQLAALEPRALAPCTNEASAYLQHAEYLVETGRDPAAALARARTAIDAGRKLAPSWPGAWFFAAYACWLEASHAAAAGADPAAALARGAAIVDAEARRSPAASSVEVHEVRGKLAATHALRLIDEGRDPGAALANARAALERAREARPWDAGFLVWSARIEALALRWDAREREVPAERVAAAAVPLLERAARPGADPRPAQVLAELHEIRAASLAARGKPAGEDIAAGLAQAEAALALNPRMAPALAAKGGLLLAWARTERDPQKRREAARGAGAALEAAIQANPLFERRVRDSIDAARELAR